MIQDPDFEVEVSPVAIPVQTAEPLKPEPRALSDSRGNRDDHVSLLKSPGNGDQLPGSMEGLLRRDHDAAAEVQVFRKGLRKDGLKAGRGFPVGVMAEFLAHAHPGDEVE